jgi:hypothetical protein
MSNILASVLIDEPTWIRICSEVSHWADIGLKEKKRPLESVFYPLTAIRLRNDRKLTPFDMVELSDVEEFVICDVFLPPREFADYGSHSAQFRALDGDEQGMQRIFTEGVGAINTRHPQLLFLGPGHSHPFSQGWTNPSGTDIEHHIRPYRRKNEDLLGCRFSLALILVRDRSGRGWQACAFAMDGHGYIRGLGIAKIVSADHRAITTARSTPFYRTRRGRIWETKQRALLRGRLIEHERWPGGWTSFLVRQDEETASLVMLPPRFPRQPPLVQKISLKEKRAGNVEPWRLGVCYKNYNLGGEGDVLYPTTRRTDE